MSSIEARLQELGFSLPAPMDPPGNFKLVNVHDGIAYVAGHPPIDGSTVLVQGVVGRDLTADERVIALRAWPAFRSSPRSKRHWASWTG
jgi:hypothetical protein